MQSNGTFRKILAALVLGLFVASCAKEPPPPPPPPPPVVEEEVIPIDPWAEYDEGSRPHMVAMVGSDRVFFAYDSDELVNAARGTLRAQAEWLNAYGYVTVTIEGHADERGTREYNLALGERRAVAVRNYLVALGVSPSRINIISYGKERPVSFCSNESCWSQNRRGVMVLN
jgi:peptidoglycan-associated lipoprotein